MLNAIRDEPVQAARGHGFRDDIEGLRALAILPILLLHSGYGGLRGGFVGVDVFFVISGYLITGNLVRELDAGRFSLVQFYHRRAIRILPALVTMLAVTALVGVMLLYPVELIDFGRAMAATSVFAGNIYFYLTADYFAGSSETKPLIHMWSLGVEEQFYLAYPLLLALIWRERRPSWRLAMLVLVALISLAVGGWTSVAAPRAAYFLISARAWELLCGAMVALGATPRIDRGWLRETLCLMALAALALAMWQTRSSLLFPVPFGLIPVGATAILIAYGESARVTDVLRLWPMRMIGRLSYVLYLVHRPLIAFTMLLCGSTLQGWAPPALLAGSLVLAALLHVTIEQPVRRIARSASPRLTLSISGCALAALAGAGLLMAGSADRIAALPPDAARAASWLGYSDTPAGRAQFSTDRCFMIPSGPTINPDCLTSVPDRPNLLLMGDSHAAQLSQALRETLPGVHLIQATAAGCRPLRGGGGLGRCHRLALAMLDRNDWSRIGTVVLAGRWLPDEVPLLAASARELAAHGTRVIVVGPMVEYDIDLPRLVARAQTRNEPGYPAKFLLPDRLALDDVISRDLASTPITYVSPRLSECKNARCTPTTEDGTPRHFDHSHFTAPAAQEFVRQTIAPLVREDQANRRFR
jgi:peptidoglycan/LPS O-acetylase OafA/YrhL